MALLISDNEITVKPNHSISVVDAARLVVVLAGVSMAVGVGFALAGAWLVLPFAGLEIAAIAYAFYYVLQRSGDYETIIIKGDEVRVEKHRRDENVRTVFQRYWAQVSVRELVNGQSGLFIGSHGKELEFGKNLLNDEQRVLLARELRQKIKNIN